MVLIATFYKKETEVLRLNNPLKRYQRSEAQSKDYSFKMPSSYCHSNVIGLSYFRE